MILWVRKSLRIIGLAFPAVALGVGALWGVRAGRWTAIVLVLFFLVLMAGIETARFLRPGVNDWLYRRMRSVLKEKERHRPSGITFFLLGALVSFAVFPLGPASAAVAFQAVGDALAETVGTRRGRIRIHGPKTLEGSAACLLGCLALVPVLALPWAEVWHLPSWGAVLPRLCAGAVAATLAELATLRWDDNLFMPPVAALVMTLAGRVL